MTTRTKIVAVPGRTIGLTVPMIASASAASEEDCEPEIAGLYWFSDASGAFDAETEAVYLMPNGEPAGPVAAVAKLIGETCGKTITWAEDWTPDDQNAPGPPLYFQADPYLLVYVDGDTAPGTLSVSATCNGADYGPIALTFVAYDCSCQADITALEWNDPWRMYTPTWTMTVCSSALNPDPDTVTATASLVGTWCPNCVVDWTLTNVYSSSMSYVGTYSSDSPDISVTLDRTWDCYYSGTLRISATVTCGSDTFGPFDIDFVLGLPT